ncbi:MAG: YciI family protein [Alphaproteobacteria bacterium]
MHFLVYYTDKPNSLALRMATRPAHLDYVKNSGCVRMGGPLLGADGEAMAGGMLVLETDTIEQARAWMDDDPYVKAGLFESTIVRAWRWTVGNPNLPKA